MNLLSLRFILFLFMSLSLYYLVPSSKQWLVLLIASYFFYAQAGTKYLIYILFTTITTFIAAKKIDLIHQQNRTLDRKNDVNQFDANKKKIKKFFIFTLFLNFGILLFLKYRDFTLQIIGWEGLFSRRFLLPLGISFYTFQSMGYLIDVKRGKIKASDHFGHFALFVSYFPQIIQGPISRWKDLAPQFVEEHKLKYENIVNGFLLMSFGLFKKLVIADRAAVLVNTVFQNYQEYQGIILFMGALFYSIQIYGDFSGGIDMIRGISEMFDIHLVDNFNHPYFSKSISEFWKRWHITLGSWMRDYLFFPLALSKPLGKLGRKTRKLFGPFVGKQVPSAIASTIVFVVVGAWHGASFKFIAYGLYNGIFVLSEPILKPFYAKMRRFFGIKDEYSKTFVLFQQLRTTFLVVIGRFFSRAYSFRHAIRMIMATFSHWNPWVLFDGSIYKLGLNEKEMTVLLFGLIVLFVISYVQEKGQSIRVWLLKEPLIFRWTLLIIWFLFILVYGYYGPNISVSDFIYRGF